MSRLGDTIRAARVAAKMSEKQLGKKCGMSESVIKDIEAVSYTHLDVYKRQVAWFTAGLSAGRPPWAMLVGCALGSPWEVMGLEAAVALAGCLMVMGIRWTLERRQGRPSRIRGTLQRTADA